MKFNGKLTKTDDDVFEITVPGGDVFRLNGNTKTAVKPGDIVVVDGELRTDKIGSKPTIDIYTISRL